MCTHSILNIISNAIMCMHIYNYCSLFKINLVTIFYLNLDNKRMDST